MKILKTSQLCGQVEIATSMAGLHSWSYTTQKGHLPTSIFWTLARREWVFFVLWVQSDPHFCSLRIALSDEHFPYSVEVNFSGLRWCSFSLEVIFISFTLAWDDADFCISGWG
jgi:hypothetical protein